jgi:hypothetical protein
MGYCNPAMVIKINYIGYCRFAVVYIKKYVWY